MGFKQINSQIINKFFTTFSIKLLSAFIAFALQYYITQIFSTEDVGLYFIGFAIFNFCIIIFSFGLHKSVMKLSAHFFSKSLINELKYSLTYGLKNQLKFTFSFSIIFLVGIIILNKIDFIQNNLFELLFFFIISIPFSSVLLLFSEFYKSTKNPNLSVFFWNLGLNLIVLLFLFYFSEISVKMLPILYLISSSILILFILIFSNKFIFYKNLLVSKQRQSIVKSFNYSRVQFFISNLCEQLKRWGPIIVLSIFISPDRIAIFTISYNIALIMMLVLFASNTIIIPYISQNFSTGKIIELEIIINRFINLTSLVCLPIFLLFLIFNFEILSLFGEDYTEGTQMLVILSFSVFIEVIFGPVGLTLQVCNEEKTFKNTNIITSTFLIVILILLIPSFGLIAACYSILITTLLNNIILYHYCKSKLNINIKPLGFYFLKELISNKKNQH